jgi:hypothetical protein
MNTINYECLRPDPDFLSPFDSRQNIQTLPIYIVVYFLDP